MTTNYVIVNPINVQIPTSDEHINITESPQMTAEQVYLVIHQSDTSFSCAQCLTECCAEFLWNLLLRILLRIVIVLVILIFLAIYAAWEDILQLIQQK